MPNEKDVLIAKKSGQAAKEAFVRLIHACEMSMYRIAKSIVRTDEAVADVMQEAILKAYDSLHGLREPRYFKTWLIRILINECQQYLRLNEKIVPIGEWIDTSGASPSYDFIALEEALNQLPEDSRVVVALFYYEDMLVRDIAALLDIPEGTVKSRLSKARKQLKELLQYEEERGINYGSQ